MNWKAFWDAMRGGFTGPLEPDEIAGTEAIGAAMAGLPIAYVAYAMGTAFKETAGTMQPIDERGGTSYFFARYDPQGPRPDIARQLGNGHPGDGARFHGRGYVQLTGRRNYSRASIELDVDLLTHPELAKRCDIAAKVMRLGMLEGWFTGRSFGSCLSGSTPDLTAFTEARRIINGQDCAHEIALYALGYHQALTKGGWA